jgi:hypothetical protein
MAHRKAVTTSIVWVQEYINAMAAFINRENNSSRFNLKNKLLLQRSLK